MAVRSLQFTVHSREKTELIDITSRIQAALDEDGVIDDGMVFVFIPHTTAAVTINECADPSVKTDMLKVLNHVIPWDMNYRHLEGNSAAHLKSTLVGASEMVAIEKGKLVLGTWQGIFFCEFDGPRSRKVNLRIL
jgi:secondary thiamine-phosphate synthase enzyme